MDASSFFVVDVKKVSSKIIVAIAVVAFVVMSIGAFLCWRSIAKRRGSIVCIIL